jgi:DNA-directed RNA polymerase specialized sigma24 family protein
MSEAQVEPPDEELIRKIREKERDVSAAKRAFAVFYDRHVQFVFRCVRNADKQLVGYGLGTDDIVEETFAKVWSSGANSYSLAGSFSPDAAYLRTRHWLASIACNLVKQNLRSRKHALPVDPRGENEELFATEPPPNSAAAHVHLMRAVASSLSERDAAIVWFKSGYYNIDTRQSQPPPDELETFCKEWNIAPAALRKAYGRSLVTLREALSCSPVFHE